MDRGQDRGRLDWLVELAGACAPAAAAGFAAMKLAPAYGFTPGVALLAGDGTSCRGYGIRMIFPLAPVSITS